MEQVRVKELAATLGGSPGRYTALAKSGQLPYEARGKRNYFDVQAVRKQIESEGLEIRGYHGGKVEEAAELSPAEQEADRIAIGAMAEAQLAAMRRFREDIENAQIHGKFKLEIMLLRRLADMLEEFDTAQSESDPAADTAEGAQSSGDDA